MIHGRQQAVGVRRKINADDVCFLVRDVIHEARILMRKAVVILLPDRRAHDEIERCNLLAPRKLIADLQPFCVLRRHRIDDAGEGFIGCEETMTAGKKVAFKPALAHVLGEHRIHDTAVRAEMIIRVKMLGVPVAVLHFEYRIETVRIRLVRPKDTEVLCIIIELEDIADKLAELGHILTVLAAMLLTDVKGVIAEIRHTQIAEQFAAVAVRIRADAVFAGRCKCRKLRKEMSFRIKQFFRMVAVQPVGENLKMLRLVHHDRHLVCQEVAFNTVSVNHLRTGPSLGSAENDHRPYRSCRISCLTGMLLDRFDGFDDRIHRLSHLAVHRHRVIAFDEIRLPSAAVEEIRDFLVAHAGKNRRIRDLVSIQMKNRKNRTVAHRIEEFVALPGSCQWTGFCLTVADGDSRNQVRIIENSAERMGDGVSELAAFIDGAGCLRSAVRRHAARERKLLEQLLHTRFILRNVRINLAVGAVEVVICNVEVSAVTGSGEKNEVKVIPLDDTV